MKKGFQIILSIAVGVLVTAFGGHTVFAANTPTLSQTINNGVLSTDILDASKVTVGSPSAGMSAKTLSFTCQSGGSASTGTLGTASQRLYVINPGGADNGWTLTLGATGGATSTWTSGGNSMDFNDATTSGCTDGADTDSKGGQLTVDPSVGTLTADCVTCTTSNITKGTSAAFNQGTTDSITLLNAALASDNVWQGYLTGATLSQTIPAETPSGTYSLNMTLTATAL